MAYLRLTKKQALNIQTFKDNFLTKPPSCAGPYYFSLSIIWVQKQNRLQWKKLEKNKLYNNAILQQYRQILSKLKRKTLIFKQVKIPSLFQLGAICVISMSCSKVKRTKLYDMASCSLTLPGKPWKCEFLLSLSFILCPSLWHPLPATSTILLFYWMNKN